MRWLLLVLIGFCLVPRSLKADGGVVQFRQEAGDLVVTLFSTPVPLRSGPADLSVLVEDSATLDAVLDAQVNLTIEQKPGDPLMLEATRREATNKILYAARPAITQPGKWQVTIIVSRRGKSNMEIRGEIEVLPAPPALVVYWPYFAIVPSAIVLFALNQRLKNKQRTVRSI